MIKDIFVPSNIGSYYIFDKRVLAFEVNSNYVQASLIHYSRNKIVVENTMSITLQDKNSISVINAIKKIATSIGRYDEVVTSLTSSAVVFKELTLPFIGREKINMIIRFEVEPLLPFTLQEAVIDFIVTDENSEKSQSTVLVAAVKQIDLSGYVDLFEKAGIALSNVTLDVFALYDFYRHDMYLSQAHASIILIDFTFDVMRIIYIQKGILKSVRLVPHGLADLMEEVDEDASLSNNDYIQEFLHKDSALSPKILEKLVLSFSKQIAMSISFFQKQIKNFIPPVKIACFGPGTTIEGFVQAAQQENQVTIELLDIKKILLKKGVSFHKKVKVDGLHGASVIVALSASRNSDINFLSTQQSLQSSALLYKQMVVAIILSTLSIVGFYFYSHYQLQIWERAYNRSKNEMIKTVKEQMNLDIKSSKRVSDIVTQAQSQLAQAKKVCFSFSQSNKSFLLYLQQLCSKIDRQAIGLDLKKISIKDKEVILQGKVKGYDELQTFEEELLELDMFTVHDLPRELSFTVTLHVKEEQDKK